MNLDLSKASSPHCIPVVVLKNCESELSYILAEIFNQCLKESCFPDCWKVTSVILVFKNIGKKLQQKTTTLLVFLWLVNSFKNLQIIELLITQRNATFFLISGVVLGLPDQLQFFRHLYLIELRGFIIGLGLLSLWHLIYPRHLTGFCMVVLITNVSLMDLVRYFALFLLFSVIVGFKWFWMWNVRKNIQLILDFLQSHILGPTLFLLYINDLPYDVICDIAIYTDDTTLCPKCDQPSDFELTSSV